MSVRINDVETLLQNYNAKNQQYYSSQGTVDDSIFTNSNYYNYSNSNYSTESIFSYNNNINSANNNNGYYAELASDNYSVQSSNTQDGMISGTYQRGTGDCWLLAGVNSLSYTDEGRKIINDALDYQDNGDIIVHLKGAGDYRITKEELEAVKNSQEAGSREYSVGDDDMLIMELAIQKVMDDIATNRVKLSSDAPAEYEKQQELMADINTYNNSITGGQITELMYLITGKQTEYLSDKESMANALEESRHKDVALGASMRDNKTVQDINGNNIELIGCHAYSIKNVTDDTVTIINPWNSNQEITLSLSTFMNAFENISKCDLTNDNKNVNYLQKLSGTDEAGNRIYTRDADGNRKITIRINGEEVEASSSREIYDDNGNLTEIKYFDEDGKEIYSDKYEVNDKKTTKNNPSKKKEVKQNLESEKEKAEKVSVVRVGNGDTTVFEIRKYDEEGNVTEKLNLSQSKIKNNFQNKNIFIDCANKYSNNEKEIDDNKILTQLSKMSWGDFESKFM